MEEKTIDKPDARDLKIAKKKKDTLQQMDLSACRSQEEKLVTVLKNTHQTITTVESCTGGAIASKIVDVPGASLVLKEAFVTYCDKAKNQLVGVHKKTLRKYTAVSEQVCRQMAKGGARTAGADLCLASTGIAGPDGTPEFPAGLVYLGCCFHKKCVVQKYHFSGTRNEIRSQAVREAINLALTCLGVTP
ncbi:MAG: CinA family protein [Eubacterium sp.]|nr:CinA family protein [Eubacterium sp.]